MDGRSTSIYTLTDPRNGEVRYVGKTVRPIQHRLALHLVLAAKERNHRAAWIGSLVTLGLRPEIAVIETVVGDDWAARERFWIAEYRRRGVRLVNATDGGDGTPGMKQSPEHTAKAAAAHRGMKWSAESRQRLSAALKGRKQSREIIERQAASKRGRKRSPELVAASAAALRGRQRPPEVVAKIAAALRRPHVELTCPQCGGSFSVVPSRHRRAQEMGREICCRRACTNEHGYSRRAPA